MQLSALALAVAALTSPAGALTKMTPETIDEAFKYGLEHKGMGYVHLLGPNWIEGPAGALLNVYTPFMMIASKTYKSEFKANPSKETMVAIRKKFGREVAYYRDTRNRPLVKFAVSMTGDSPDFATHYTARIEGFGRGKVFSLKPKKDVRDKIADPVNVGGKTLYEAVNGYYFPLNEIEHLDEYKLILTSPSAETLVFNIRNSRLL